MGGDSVQQDSCLLPPIAARSRHNPARACQLAHPRGAAGVCGPPQKEPLQCPGCSCASLRTGRAAVPWHMPGAAWVAGVPHDKVEPVGRSKPKPHAAPCSPSPVLPRAGTPSLPHGDPSAGKVGPAQAGGRSGALLRTLPNPVLPCQMPGALGAACAPVQRPSWSRRRLQNTQHTPSFL